MYDRAFVCVCDTRYLPGLWALLNSIAVYHGNELRVFVALHDRFRQESIESLRRHPLSEAVTWIDTSERKLWDLTMPRGPLPCVRIGQSVRYVPDDLDEFIAAMRTTTNA